jgi:hypothetical protein
LASSTEAEAALHRLLDHHQKWLMSQPEFLLLWTQDRQTRRRVAALLAKELTTIPVRDINENTPPNRAMRKAILAELKRQAGAEWGRDGLAFLEGLA